MSNTHAISLKRSTALLAALTFLTLLTVVNFSAFFGKASAADLTSRSLALSSTLIGTEVGSGTPGDADNGSEAIHTFSFTVPNAATSATFTYCTTAIGPGDTGTDNGCTAPAGLSLTGVATSTNALDVAFGTASGTSNQITWTATIPTGAVVVKFTSVTNPTDLGSFFVRVATNVGDEGTVASSITEGIEITARVAETLGFSTTGDFTGVGVPGGSCAPLTGDGAITLGDPTEGTLDLTKAYDNYSAFRLYTNAAEGVDVQYHGETLTRTSGGDIDAIGAAAEISLPEEQFGLAIDTSVGGNGAVPIESGTDLDMANVTTSANFANGGALSFETAYENGGGTLTHNSGTAQFAFVAGTPTRIAYTAGYTECKTAAVRYIANISPTTTSGTYTTTIVYSAVPKY